MGITCVYHTHTQIYMGNFVPYSNTTRMGWVRMLDQRDLWACGVLQIPNTSAPYREETKTI
jgi:hypothetical protein